MNVLGCANFYISIAKFLLDQFKNTGKYDFFKKTKV